MPPPQRRRSTCSRCGQAGHNVLTCSSSTLAFLPQQQTLRCCVFDIETTGFKRHHVDSASVDQIIQLAGIVVELHRVEDSPATLKRIQGGGGQFSTKIKTSRPISRFAFQAHHLTLEMLQSSPSFKTAWNGSPHFEGFVQFCERNDVSVLIGHNAIAFDFQMIAAHRYHDPTLKWPSGLNHIIDTLRLVRFLRKQGEIDSLDCKLGTLFEKVSGLPLDGAHDALVDCDALLRVIVETPNLLASLEDPSTVAASRCIGTAQGLAASFNSKMERLVASQASVDPETEVARARFEGDPVDLFDEGATEMTTPICILDEDDQEEPCNDDSVTSCEVSTSSSVAETPIPSETWGEVDEAGTIPNFSDAIVVGSTLRNRRFLSVLDAFCLFFTDAIVDMIIEESNIYYQEQKGTEDELFNKKVFFLFVECLIYAGIQKRDTHMKHWWAPHDSSQYSLRFSAVARTMDKATFLNALRFLHFTQETYDQSEVIDDRAYKVRPLLTCLNDRFMAVYNCSQCVSVDEAMIPLKSRVRIKQYMKAKPTRWGIKMWVLAESVTGYVKCVDIYLGAHSKDPYPALTSMPSPSKAVLSLLAKSSMLGLGHIVFMDNLFSSIPLAEYLAERGTHMVGTVRKNRKGFPISRLNVDRKKRFEYKQVKRGDGLLATAWVDRRPIYVLSTFIPSTTVGSAERYHEGHRQSVPRPSIIGMYNKYMGGVDLADCMRSYYMIRLKQIRRWYIHVFFYLLDTSIHNANVLYNHHNADSENMSALAFRQALAAALHAKFDPEPSAAEKREAQIIRKHNLVRSSHNVIRVHKRSRCVFCKNDKSKVRTKCKECGVYLHGKRDEITGLLPQCWVRYHQHLFAGTMDAS